MLGNQSGHPKLKHRSKTRKGFRREKTIFKKSAEVRREGYGVSKAGVDFAFENNYTLIISLDCGIKSFELIQYAKELGIDFIVCDNHLPDDELPSAVAILNPR